MVRLESIALWEEKELFSELAAEKPEYGAIGIIRGYFHQSGQGFLHEFRQIKEGTEVCQSVDELLYFLQSCDGGFMLKDEAHMIAYCRDKMTDHVPYSFNRECWGFRVISEDFIWYIACTPWNVKRHFTVYGYDRITLMTCLAKRHGLPENCYGVLFYTGERIHIRFGAEGFDSFPQYGGNSDENRRYALTMNEPQKITREQTAAMEGGAVFGWDTPVADSANYDSEGRYVPPVREEPRRGEKRRR